jgi:hypothetical protein
LDVVIDFFFGFFRVFLFVVGSAKERATRLASQNGL